MVSNAELRALPLKVDPLIFDLEDAAGTIGGIPHRWRWTMYGLDEIPGGALIALEHLSKSLISAGGAGTDLSELALGPELELRNLVRQHGARTNMVEVLGADDPLAVAVESTDSLLSAAGRAVAEQSSHPQTGILERISVSGGGVPKQSTDAVHIGARGLDGDTQKTRRHHGRPFQAVCLFSAEVISELRSEGHPITAGSVGENLTVAGIDWSGIRPGTRLRIGDGENPVVLEVTSWAPPCQNIAGSFSDGWFRHLDFDLHPGRARAYAWVLASGEIRAGDPLRTLP